MAARLATKVLDKVVKGALVGFTGYEIGHSSSQDVIEFRPNISIAIPSSQKGNGEESWLGTSVHAKVIIGLVTLLIILIIAKAVLSKYIKYIRNSSNANTVHYQPNQLHQIQYQQGQPFNASQPAVHVCA